jgi:predicted lipoprotein with Yx(FWY)xxD motif
MRRVRLAVVIGVLGLLVVAAPVAGARAKAKPKPKPTTTTTAPPAPSVQAASAGALGTILVDASGMTLYRYMPESNGKVACTGGCAAAWPPLLRTGTAAPVLAKRIPGSVGTVTRPDRAVQVTYDGIPLYHFVGDAKRGATNGQGIGNVWFVVKPGDTLTSAPSGATTTTTARPATAPPAAPGYGVPSY